MAAKALSSEPESFPIEAHIVPLVFELKRLGVFTPCWSCEGHNDNAGKLRRAPAVWFYCDSVVQVRLLAQGIEQLGFQKELCTAWRVGISVAEPDNPDTLYQLEPVLQDFSQATLDHLRADVRVIAHHLSHFVLDAASTMAKQTS